MLYGHIYLNVFILVSMHVCNMCMPWRVLGGQRTTGGTCTLLPLCVTRLAGSASTHRAAAPAREQHRDSRSLCARLSFPSCGRGGGCRASRMGSCPPANKWLWGFRKGPRCEVTEWWAFGAAASRARETSSSPGFSEPPPDLSMSLGYI